MDGTLLESTEADYKAWEKVFRKYGRELTYEQYVPMLGIRSADVIRDFLGFKDEGDVKRILVEKFNSFVDVVNEEPVKIVPAADVMLQSLSAYNVKVALATSSRKEKMNLLLDKLNLRQYFDATVSGEEVQNSKPAPDIFLRAAEKVGIDPRYCLVVEDAVLGIRGAKSAGMKCLAVATTTTTDKLIEADVVVNGYEGIDMGDVCRAIVKGEK